MNNKHFTIITFYQFKKDFDQTGVLLELNDYCKFNKKAMPPKLEVK